MKRWMPGDQPFQRVAALREVDDNQPQEHAGDDNVDRHPGVDVEQGQGTNATITVINKARWTAHRERARPEARF